MPGQGWPDLACLVVRKSDGLPGEGYFTSLRSAGAYAGPSIGPMAASFVRGRQASASAMGAGRNATDKATS